MSYVELTSEEYKTSTKIVDESIRLNRIDFTIYLNDKIEEYIKTTDLNNLENRRHLHGWLSHLRTLYLNITLNFNIFFN